MASRRDGQGNFSSQRFEQLFASSPRAKEIFASLYEKQGKKPFIPKAKYPNRFDKSGPKLRNLKTSLRNEGSKKNATFPRSSYQTDKIIQRENLVDGSKHLDLNPGNRDLNPGNLTSENAAGLYQDDSENIAAVNRHNSQKNAGLHQDYSENTLVRNDLSQRDENTISFLEDQDDEENDNLDSLNNQVFAVLQKLNETEKRCTRQTNETVKQTKKSEQTLTNWSLRTVESNNERLVIVEGQKSIMDNQKWRSTAICERVSSRCLKTKSGSLYHLAGKIDEQLMAEKGFSKQLIKAFRNGFPAEWKKLLKKHHQQVESSEIKRSIAKEKENNMVKEQEQNIIKEKDIIPEKKVNERKGNTKAKMKNDHVKEDKNVENQKAGKMEKYKLITQQKTARNTPGKFSKKTDFNTPPCKLPKNEEVKRSRSGRIIAPPLEFWRGQRMVTTPCDDVVNIVKCHLDEKSVQQVPRFTPLSRREPWTDPSQNRRESLKGIRHHRNRLETAVKSEYPTSGSESVENVLSESQSDSTVAKTLTYTSTDSSADQVDFCRNENPVSKNSKDKQDVDSDFYISKKSKVKGNEYKKLTESVEWNKKKEITADRLDEESLNEDLSPDEFGTGSIEVSTNHRIVRSYESENDKTEENGKTSSAIQSIRFRLRSACNKPDVKNGLDVDQRKNATGWKRITRLQRVLKHTKHESTELSNVAKHKQMRAESKNKEPMKCAKVSDIESSDSECVRVTRHMTATTASESSQEHKLQSSSSESAQRTRSSFSGKSTGKGDLQSSDSEITKVTRGSCSFAARMITKNDNLDSSDVEIRKKTRSMTARISPRTNELRTSDSEESTIGRRWVNKREARKTQIGKITSTKTTRNEVMTSCATSKQALDLMNNNKSQVSDSESLGEIRVKKKTAKKSQTMLEPDSSESEGCLNRNNTDLKDARKKSPQVILGKTRGNTRSLNGFVKEASSDVVDTTMKMNSMSGNTKCTTRSRTRLQLKKQGNDETGISAIKNKEIHTGPSAVSRSMEIKNKRVKDVSPTGKPAKRQDISGKKVVNIQSTVQLTDEEMWMADEHDRLLQAMSQIPPSTAMYWQKIAQLVKTRSAEECQLHIQNEKSSKKAKKAPRKVQEKPVVKSLTAKPGTLARKRQLREILERQDDGYEDDIFDSTPFRNKKVVKFSPVDLDDFGCDDVMLIDTSPDYKTPSSRTPVNRLRPAGPLSESGASETECITPGLLKSVNRNDIDRYVHQLKKRKFGRNLKLKSHSPASTKRSSPRAISLDVDASFNVCEVAPTETEDDDDYFSDE